VIQIGVDFGGTKIEAAALAENGQFLARIRTGNPGSYQPALETIQRLVAEVEAQCGEQGTVGVGTPGSICPSTSRMRNANTVWLNDQTLREDLSRLMGRPIRLANDANCLALSETVDGAAAGSRCVFAAILGTGCGGGIVVNGKLLEGAHGLGGEWGHMPLPLAPDEPNEWPRCWCGRAGCLEMWISGTGLARDYLAATGTRRTAEAVIELMRFGEPAATAAFDRFLHRLARSLAAICNILDPDTIVLGGGLSNVTEIYARLPTLIKVHTFGDSWNARLAPARWGDSSGVRGAARLWQPD
jgi:fructokinase